MKKPQLLTIGILFFTCCLTAQSIERQLVGVAGEATSAKDIILEWTLGEPLITLENVPFGYCKQGFLQTYYFNQDQKNDYSNPAFPGQFSVEVFPNPFHAGFTLQTDHPVETDFYHAVLDYSGKVLMKNTFPAGSLTLDFMMNEYPAGLYFLQFADSSGKIMHSFKLIKL